MGHTPGPWEIYDRETEMGGYRYWVEREEGDGHLIVAEVGKTHDARLIAAAPELLAALEEVVNWHNDVEYYLPQRIQEMMDAALAKARGE